MSSQLDRNQELWDFVQLLERRITDLETYLNAQYEDEYNEEDL